MTLPKYPEYKDSGVAWLEDVPSHWEVYPLKRELLFLTSGSRGWAEHYADDGALFIRIGNLTRDSTRLDLADIQRVAPPEGTEGERTMVRAGDVLFSITAYLGSVAVIPDDIERAYVSQHVALARLRGQRILPTWAAYVALSWVGRTYLETQGYGGTKVQLSLDDVANLLLTAPPLIEQLTIATFLDHETAKIDVLIAEQEKLITLLDEKRQATISHAVIHGLSPDVPMKESGVAWLGQMPAHWALVRMKRVVSTIEQGWSPQCESYPASEPDDWGVLKVGCVNGGTFKAMENKKLPDELEPVPAYSLKRGDLLVSRANTRELVGSAAVVAHDFDRLLLCDKLYRLRLLEANCLPEFASAYLGTREARSQIELDATGASSSMLNIGQSVVLDLLMPLPNIEEQRKIVEFLQSETARLGNLSGDAQRAISLLKERRSALIAAAVTGQIDVCGAVMTSSEQIEAAAA